nr:hypothetical protein [Variovorax boronicumulans]
MSAAACSAILSVPFGTRMQATTPSGVVGAADISTKTTTTITG